MLHGSCTLGKRQRLVIEVNISVFVSLEELRYNDGFCSITGPWCILLNNNLIKIAHNNTEKQLYPLISSGNMFLSFNQKFCAMMPPMSSSVIGNEFTPAGPISATPLQQSAPLFLPVREK